MVDRKKFEFRKVLGRVSDGLGQENLKALSNLCTDIIGVKKAEAIDSGVTLFNALIEEGMCMSKCEGGGNNVLYYLL